MRSDSARIVRRSPGSEAEMTNEGLTRGRLPRSAGAAGLATVFGARALGLFDEDAQASTTACLLTPEVTEGPYWIDESFTRRNVTEGKPGMPLLLRFTVLNAKTCSPIRNADVEIWHCDASGVYSGVNGSSTHLLRGHQRSDGAGKAEFLTVFPGWYPGRTPHIHIKVSAGGNLVHTGQVFLPEAITRKVYAQPPYARRGRYDTSHAADMIFAQAGGASAVAKLVRRRGAKGYVGSIAVGVAS